MLDTPFAFQMNRAELVTQTRSYFAQSVGREVEVAAWSGREDAAQAGKSLALLDRAAWAFAGPGSRRTRCGSGAARRSRPLSPASYAEAAPSSSAVPPR